MTIAIVGYGAVFADAPDAKTLWKNLLDDKVSIKPLPEQRFAKQLLNNNWQTDKHDEITTNIAGFVDETILQKLAKENNVDYKDETRLNILALAATKDALQRHRLKAREKESCAVVLGCMAQDESWVANYMINYLEKNTNALLQTVHPDLKRDINEIIKDEISHYKNQARPSQKALLASSCLQVLRKRYNIAGRNFLVDAACASSLAAVDAACNLLEANKCAIAITGGVEANLRPESFIMFSRVGALAQKPCTPFTDDKNDGLSQGEGAGIIILKRHEDAIRDKDTIYGVIVGRGSSSDGNTESLFAPTAKGQMRAYEQAYKNASKKAIIHIEAHATGTKQGDFTEQISLHSFFHKQITAQNLTLGTIKKNIGHTKGAAGIASIIKTLCMFEHNKIPTSTTIKKPKQSKTVQAREYIFQNSDVVGVSSFGFGGINYHVALQKEVPRLEKSQIKTDTKIDIIVKTITSTTHETHADMYMLKIKPNTVQNIARAQILASISALHAKDYLETIKNIHIPKNTIFLAQTTLGSKKLDQLGVFLCLKQLLIRCSQQKHIVWEQLRTLLQDFPDISEEIGPGCLNNCVAARASKLLELTGSNINIDCSEGTGAIFEQAALWCSTTKKNIAILSIAKEDVDFIEGVTTTSVDTQVVCQHNALPKAIQQTLQKITYENECE